MTQYHFEIYRQFEDRWERVKTWNFLTTMVAYANNYHGNTLDYNRTRYHLNKNKEYQFNCRNGIWSNRILKESTE